MVRSFDGRIQSTLLTDKVFEQLKVHSVEELIAFVYSKNTAKKDIAALSILLSDTCMQGDNASLHIAEKGTAELLTLVNPIVNKLGLHAGPLALSGSILTKDLFIRSLFMERVHAIYNDMLCIEPQYSASYGAVLLAQECLK